MKRSNFFFRNIYTDSKQANSNRAEQTIDENKSPKMNEQKLTRRITKIERKRKREELTN